MLTAVVFWEIFYNYTLSTALTVSTTATACVHKRCWMFQRLQRHCVLHGMCATSFCTMPQPQFAPCIFGIFPRQTPQMQIVYKCGLVQGACVGNFCSEK